MSYVGNTPALKYVNFVAQHFTTSATTSYTLDQSVSNEVEIALFINNVRQEPGSSYSYTATGTALTLSQATASSDTMYCVFIGKAVETNNPPAGSVNTSELVDNAVTTAKIINNSITTAKIVNDAVTVDKLNLISTASVPSLEAKGTSGVTEGYIKLNCSENTHGIKIKSPPHSASANYTLTMPTTDGNSSEFLQTNGSGALTWAEAGGGGKIGQVIQTVKTTTFSTSSTSFTDVTGMSVAITPSATSSKVLVTVQFTAGETSGYKFYTTLLRGSTEIYIGNAAGSRVRDSYGGKANANDDTRSVSLTFLDSPSTTSATTYKLQGKTESSGVFYVNMSKSSNDSDSGVLSREASSITVMEVLA